MTKFHFIRAEQKVEGNIPFLYLIGRDLITLQKHTFKVHGFRTYFYALESEALPKSSGILDIIPGFTSLFGDKCKKVVVSSTGDINQITKFLSKHFEADVGRNYVRRFLIDTGIKSTFSVPDELSDELYYTQITGE